MICYLPPRKTYFERHRAARRRHLTIAAAIAAIALLPITATAWNAIRPKPNYDAVIEGENGFTINHHDHVLVWDGTQYLALDGSRDGNLLPIAHLTCRGRR